MQRVISLSSFPSLFLLLFPLENSLLSLSNIDPVLNICKDSTFILLKKVSIVIPTSQFSMVIRLILPQQDSNNQPPQSELLYQSIIVDPEQLGEKDSGVGISNSQVLMEYFCSAAEQPVCFHPQAVLGVFQVALTVLFLYRLTEQFLLQKFRQVSNRIFLIPYCLNLCKS